MEKKKSRFQDYFIIIAVIFVLLVSILVIVQYVSVNNYTKAFSSEQEDICKTPPGYTDAQWREHMGHHPDRYAECLNK